MQNVGPRKGGRGGGSKPLAEVDGLIKVKEHTLTSMPEDGPPRGKGGERKCRDLAPDAAKVPLVRE